MCTENPKLYKQKRVLKHRWACTTVYVTGCFKFLPKLPMMLENSPKLCAKCSPLFSYVAFVRIYCHSNIHKTKLSS